MDDVLQALEEGLGIMMLIQVLMIGTSAEQLQRPFKISVLKYQSNLGKVVHGLQSLEKEATWSVPCFLLES